jgi:hypothetical protein
MKDVFLTPLIIFLLLLLVNALEKTFHIVGVSENIYHFLINTYFIVLLAIDLTFVFILIRDLRYSNLE